jgi:GNAT superfamily N-acetyltransferase
MTVLCRPAGPDDIEAIATVRIRSWQGGYKGIVPQDYLDVLTPEAEAQRMYARGLRPGNHVAEVDGRVVGWSAVGPYNDEEEIPPPTAHAGEVYAIYVLPDSWGTGVGRALMAYSLERLAGLGLAPVLLWVLTENVRARRFYAAAGFVWDGSSHTYSVGGKDLPEVRYRHPA